MVKIENGVICITPFNLTMKKCNCCDLHSSTKISEQKTKQITKYSYTFKVFENSVNIIQSYFYNNYVYQTKHLINILTQ